MSYLVSKTIQNDVYSRVYSRYSDEITKLFERAWYKGDITMDEAEKQVEQIKLKIKEEAEREEAEQS